MADLEQRIRERAYLLWEEDGRPHGRDMEYWERARFLIGIEDNADAALLPNPMVEAEAKGWHTPPPPEPVEPIEALENQGEFPDRFTDQGEKSPGPIRRRQPAAPKQAAPAKPAAAEPEVAKSKPAKAKPAAADKTAKPTKPKAKKKD